MQTLPAVRGHRRLPASVAPDLIPAAMYRYEIDQPARLVVASFEGEVTDSDLFDYLAHMLSHSGYKQGWRSLIDLTTAATVSLTSAGVQRMHALPLHMEERLKGARVAILAPEASNALQMARLYEKMGATKTYAIAVFTDRERAMKWLVAEGDAAYGTP